MKKYLLLTGSVCLLLFNACKEIGPAIDFRSDAVDTLFGERAYDTSYSGPVPAAEPKKVLVEEYTGVRCPNCPAGATILKNYANANPGKIVIVALHSGSLTEPISGKSKYNFSNPEVQNLVNNYLGENTPNKPAAAIDRRVIGTGMFVVNRDQWPTYIGQRSALSSPVNLSVTSKYDSAFKKVVVKVKVIYTQTVTQNQHISLWVVEHKIIDAQYDGTELIPSYEHNHVFRDFITPVSGVRILSGESSKTPGIVYERQFVYEPKFFSDSALDHWNLDNCTIVAVVHNDESGNKEVSQVMEVDLK